MRIRVSHWRNYEVEDLMEALSSARIDAGFKRIDGEVFVQF